MCVCVCADKYISTLKYAVHSHSLSLNPTSQLEFQASMLMDLVQIQSPECSITEENGLLSQTDNAGGMLVMFPSQRIAGAVL